MTSKRKRNASTTVSEIDPGVSLDIVGCVQRALVARGVDVADLVAPDSFGLVVPGAAADALFDRGAKVLGDPAIGISLVADIPIGGLGLMDYVLCTSATARESMGKIARYSVASSQRLRLDFVEEGEHGVLRIHELGGTHSRHWMDFAFGVLTARLRQTIGAELSFLQVKFRHEAPPDPASHEAHFRTNVQFGADENVVTFDGALLGRPLRTSSHELAKLLEKRLQELAPTFDAVDPFVTKARTVVVAMLDEGRTEVDELARRLATSRRSLQRTLGDLGTSHSALLDEVRRERAVQLLENGRRVADVSDALVFSAPSAFFRAYRRWTGTSPRSRTRGA